jgi:hypothetical protein
MVYYEQPAKYDLWLWLIIILIPLGLIIGGFWLYTHQEVEDAMAGAITLWACGAFCLILFIAIMPRKYQILDDRLKIVLGGFFAFNIPFNTIKEVEYPSTKSPLWVVGWGFSGSVNRKYYVVIKRGHEMDVMIAPQNAELFVENLRTRL